MRTATAFVIALCAGVAFAKLPAPTEDTKAKADEAAAKSAWSDKVAAFQLCQAQDRVVARYRSGAMSAAKPTLPAMTMPPCADPGPFASPLAAKPLEASGAHSPTETAKGPPSSNATAAEIAGGIKKK
jgi:hypothetical protein